MSDPTEEQTQSEFEVELLHLAEEMERRASGGANGAKPVPGSAAKDEMLEAELLRGKLENIENLLANLLSDSVRPKRQQTKRAIPELAQLEPLLRQLERKNAIETANERLFDAMHAELRGYKDNFLFDALQKPMLRDLLQLHDDLAGVVRQMEESGNGDGSRATGAASHSRDNVDNALHFLREILNRVDVVRIEEPGKVFDSRIHRVVEVAQAGGPEDDGAIERVTRDGFEWRGRVFRPADVVVRRWRGTSPAAAAGASPG